MIFYKYVKTILSLLFTVMTLKYIILFTIRM